MLFKRVLLFGFVTIRMTEVGSKMWGIILLFFVAFVYPEDKINVKFILRLLGIGRYGN